MARSNSFVFIPVSEPEIMRGQKEEQGTLPAEYPLAELASGIYKFDYKFVILADPNGKESWFQVLTKDSIGEFTIAMNSDRYPIENTYLKISLIDVYGDGSKYKFRLESGEGKTDPVNRLILGKGRRPNLEIAETKFTSDNTLITELNFIGTIDVRIGLTGRVVTPFTPGQEFELCVKEGDLIFHY